MDVKEYISQKNQGIFIILLCMKSVYEYLEYREYLNDYYLFRKKKRDSFSLRFFGDKIQIDASYLSKIMKLERHISTKSLPLLCDYLKLPYEEENYLCHLVAFNKSKKEVEREIFFKKLISLRPRKQRNLERSQYEFYSEWYYSALRSILEFTEFYEGDSYRDLGEQLSPPISAREAKKGIELLKHLELIAQNDEGRYIIADKAISSGDSWRSVAINAYQKKVIELSADSIDNHPKEIRDISTVTMNITESEFVEIKKMIKEFRSSVIEYVNEAAEPDQTYQLNMQLIPLSRKK